MDQNIVSLSAFAGFCSYAYSVFFESWYKRKSIAGIHFSFVIFVYMFLVITLEGVFDTSNILVRILFLAAPLLWCVAVSLCVFRCEKKVLTASVAVALLLASPALYGPPGQLVAFVYAGGLMLFAACVSLSRGRIERIFDSGF
jgi:hypothetical protein